MKPYTVIARADDTGQDRVAAEFRTEKAARDYAERSNNAARCGGSATTYRVRQTRVDPPASRGGADPAAPFRLDLPLTRTEAMTLWGVLGKVLASVERGPQKGLLSAQETAEMTWVHNRLAARCQAAIEGRPMPPMVGD